MRIHRRCPLQRSDGNLHTSHLNVVFHLGTCSRLGSLFVNLFMCDSRNTSDAAWRYEIRCRRSVCERDGFNCNQCFFGCTELTVDPRFAANSCIGIKLLCHSAAHGLAGSCVAWVKRAVRLEEFVSTRVRVARGAAALFAATPPVHLAGAWCYLPKATLPTAPPSAGAIMSDGLACLPVSVSGRRASLSAGDGGGSSACHTDLACRHVGRVV